jgi:hypothetical protein
VETTKVKMGVGQFRDPFELFDEGGWELPECKQGDGSGLSYEDVWENKKRIEETFEEMQAALDKRTYESMRTEE